MTPGGAAGCCAIGGHGGAGEMVYYGDGSGDYIQETTYRYVGYGGNFGMVRRRSWNIVICVGVPLLCLLPLLLWWLWFLQPYDCDQDFATWPISWSERKKDYCCRWEGKGCPFTTTPSTSPNLIETTTNPPTPPPFTTTTPFITTRWVDPNCAVDPIYTWSQFKKDWCCKNHHVGCPGTTTSPFPAPAPPPGPVDPYNCADGWANWQAGWSVAKKGWCCKVHHKGCSDGGGCVTTSKPYDCMAGLANWQAGWSIGKKAWCCTNEGKGCPESGGCV